MPNNRDYGTEEVVYPVTVTLVADPNPTRLKMFFCFSSQTPIVQYEGIVISVLPGQSPYIPYTLIKCKDHRCPLAYCFNPIVEMSQKYIL